MAIDDAELVLNVDDPTAPDVAELLATHLEFSHGETPPGHVHALDIDGLVADDITFVSARRAGQLLGVGALRPLDGHHAELKSMQTAAGARGQGIGTDMVEHLVALARARGCSRVSLETGAIDAYAPARALYEKLGFQVCPPFGDYTDNPYSQCMTMLLTSSS